MQPDQITLNVDVLNDGVTVAQVYDRFSEFQNRTVYAGVNSAPEARDEITLYRTFPTKNGNFNGVKKSAMKITEDVTVTGADGVSQLTAPVIIEISCSVPTGTTDAKLLEVMQRAVALADTTVATDLAGKMRI